MTLTKAKMVSEIGRRTRLKNWDIQRAIETLIEVWTDELVSGGRIELENFVVIEVQTIDRGENLGRLSTGDAPRYIRRIALRISKRVKEMLPQRDTST